MHEHHEGGCGGGCHGRGHGEGQGGPRGGEEFGPRMRHRQGGGFGPGGGQFGPGFFGGFGPGGGPRFGRGPKAARGDVRLAILTLVGEEPRHGYQIIQELSNRSNGMWQPSPGSIYPTLQALEDEGLLSSENIEGKRVYSLTEAGRGYLSANARPTPPWEEIAGDPASGFHTLRREIFQLGAAAMQVAQNSNEEQLARAAKILADARKSIYRMLAEDED